MKVILVGKNGQLGRDCRQVFQGVHDLLALGAKELDVTDPVQVEDLVRRQRPEVILNCAGYTKVDAAEREQDLAYRLNVIGPSNLAASLARHGGTLLHISTDYVFDGRKPVPAPYREDDAAGPLSYYGQTKAAAEAAISQTLDDFIIVRTSWLYGRWGHNFLRTILRLALARPQTSPIRIVNDQFGAPTWTWRLAQQLAVIVAAGGRGLYHATAAGWVTWFEVARCFFQEMNLMADLQPCTTAAFASAAPRPRNSILANHRLETAGLYLMRPWQSDLKDFIKLYRAELICEAAPDTKPRSF